MVFNVLFLAALCTEVVSGLAFEAARATQHAKELESGWTPAPTSAPRIPHELLKRQSSAASSFFASTFLQGSDGTCGYLSGSVGAAFTCGGAATCNLWPARQSTVLGAVACCNGFDCNPTFECINSREYSSKCNDACDADIYVLKCTDAARPFCNTAVWGDADVMDLYCASRQVLTTQTFYTTYDGQTVGGKFRVVYDTVTTSSSRRPVSSSTSRSVFGGFSFSDVESETASSTSTSTPIFTPGSTTPADPSDFGFNKSSSSKKKAPIGAIIGGVIGGIAVISSLIAFILRRRRAKKHAAAAAVPVHTDSHEQAPPPVYNPSTAPPPATSEMDGVGKPPPMASVSEHGYFAPAPLPKPYGEGSQYAQDPNGVLSSNGGDTRRTSAVSPISPPSQYATTNAGGSPPSQYATTNAGGSPPPPGASQSYVSGATYETYPSYPPPGAHELPPAAHEMPGNEVRRY